jgi:hypothetical protein
LRIAPFAVISGTVRGLSGAIPWSASTMVFVSARRRERQAGLATVRTRGHGHDRGAYRISGLIAGDYLVCACTRDPIPFDSTLLTTIASEPIGLLAVAGRALAVGADVVTLDNTVKTFAPPVPSGFGDAAARATKITLAPGDDRDRRGRFSSIWFAPRACREGSSAPRVAVQASAVRLLPATDAESGIDFTQISPMLVQADGRFDFAPVRRPGNIN